MTDYNPEIDAWRSIMEALAIVNGGDPEHAVEQHRQWCKKMGLEGGEDG